MLSQWRLKLSLRDRDGNTGVLQFGIADTPVFSSLLAQVNGVIVPVLAGVSDAAVVQMTLQVSNPGVVAPGGGGTAAIDSKVIAIVENAFGNLHAVSIPGVPQSAFMVSGRYRNVHVTPAYRVLVAGLLEGYGFWTKDNEPLGDTIVAAARVV